MNNNKKLEIAGFTGIATFVAFGFFIYAYILLQLINVIDSLQVTVFNH